MVNDCINFVSSGWYQYVDFLYVYVDMLYACVCTCVWVPPVCICGEAWGQCWASFFLCCCPLDFLRTKSLTGPHGLASESLGSTPGPPSILSFQASATLPHFYVGAGAPDSVLMCGEQACVLSHTAISPGLNMGLQQFLENEISISCKISSIKQS